MAVDIEMREAEREAREAAGHDPARQLPWGHRRDVEEERAGKEIEERARAGEHFPASPHSG